MQGGQLRQRVTLLAPTVTRDAVGGEVTSYGDLAEVFAEVKLSPSRADEQFLAAIDQRQAINLYRVRIRYRTDVSVLYRLRYNGAELKIHSVGDPEGRKRELRLVASDVQE